MPHPPTQVSLILSLPLSLTLSLSLSPPLYLSLPSSLTLSVSLCLSVSDESQTNILEGLTKYRTQTKPNKTKQNQSCAGPVLKHFLFGSLSFPRTTLRIIIKFPGAPQLPIVLFFFLQIMGISVFVCKICNNLC